MRHAMTTVAAVAGITILALAGSGAAVGADQPTTSPSSSQAAADEPASPVRGTRFGGTVFDQPGESYRDAFLRTQQAYGGRLGMVRVFYPGLPAPWSTIDAQVDDTRLIVSFRASPSDILSGRHDAYLRSWFSNAPTEYRTRYTYWHEPEDDAERGGLNTTQYRAAWQHIKALANSTANAERLRATLILMCWTLERNSGRQWRTFYPGDSVIDVMAFDCYNAGHRNNTYRVPSQLLSNAAAVSRETGKPWGVAELGSVIVGGDNGTGRARWLQETAQYARDNGAAFVSYFDSDVGTDYRLMDAPSRNAWRSIVSGQFG